MGFNKTLWAQTFAFVTTLASIYPLTLNLSYRLYPPLRDSLPFAVGLWTLTFYLFWTVLLRVCSYLRKTYGLLKGESPRRRLTPAELFRWRLTTLISLSGRTAAIFLSGKDWRAHPWSQPTLANMPDWTFAFTVMAYVVTMDGIFYTAHRAQHQIPFLYKHVHSLHHTIALPSAVTTLHDSVLEKIFNGFVQLYLAGCICPIPFWHLHYACYNIFLAEIIGHSGVKIDMSPPYTPLLDFLDVGITIEGHDLHHRVTRSNFGKQTLLWDKLFGTHLESLETRSVSPTVWTLFGKQERLVHPGCVIEDDEVPVATPAPKED